MDQRERRRSDKTKAAKAKIKRQGIGKVSRRYYLTPKVAAKRCSHCGQLGAVAYRAADRKRACQSCIDRLGINAVESTNWIEAGRKPYAPVTVRYVAPQTLKALTPTSP